MSKLATETRIDAEPSDVSPVADEPAAPNESNQKASGSEAESRAARSSVAIMILATLAVLCSLYFARAVLMPIVMAITLALLFRPFVRRCSKFRVPHVVSAAVTLLATVIVAGGAVVYLVSPAKEWIENAPEHLHEAGAKLRVVREQIDQINAASAKVQELAEGDKETASDPFPFAAGQVSVEEQSDHPTGPSNTSRPSDIETEEVNKVGRGDTSVAGATGSRNAEGPPAQAESGPIAPQAAVSDADKPVPVEVRQPRLTTGMVFLSSTGSFLAEIVVTLVLTFFLLSSGDVLINNVLRILPTFREKRSAVELVYSVERNISSYLLTVTCINVGLGLAIGTAMWLLGLPNPALWGAMATLLNFIPFIGALVGTVVVFLVAVLSFDSIAYAAVIPLVYFALTALEGNVITPHLLGRSMSLNPIMVFLSLTFWGWMWGIGGAVLAVPILATLKVGFDQFDRTRSIGTLLGGNGQL